VEFFAENFPRIQAAAKAAGRKPDAVTGAAYVTLALDANPAAAEKRLHDFLEGYYSTPAKVIMARQATYAWPDRRLRRVAPALDQRGRPPHLPPFRRRRPADPSGRGRVKALPRLKLG
jgi:alkanesulfonate monooxygenase SsuD/methylene tetrahydromethanopterin reductase-like flavin-dependent oxidoreductase (luciferase family)